MFSLTGRSLGAEGCAHTLPLHLAPTPIRVTPCTPCAASPPCSPPPGPPLRPAVALGRGAAAAGLTHGSSLALQLAVQETLSDLSVPEGLEEGEGEPAAVAETAAAREGAILGAKRPLPRPRGLPRVPLCASGCLRTLTWMPPACLPVVPVCLPAEEGEDEPPATQPSAAAVAARLPVDYGRELWRDFFSVTPATTSAPSDGLDFIAP